MTKNVSVMAECDSVKHLINLKMCSFVCGGLWWAYSHLSLKVATPTQFFMTMMMQLSTNGKTKISYRPELLLCQTVNLLMSAVKLDSLTWQSMRSDSLLETHLDGQ